MKPSRDARRRNPGLRSTELGDQRGWESTQLSPARSMAMPEHRMSSSSCAQFSGSCLDTQSHFRSVDMGPGRAEVEHCPWFARSRIYRHPQLEACSRLLLEGGDRSAEIGRETNGNLHAKSLRRG